LATVHGIVTQSGGLVVVESTAGRGTCFVVSLPRAREAGVRAPSPSSSSTLASAPGSRHVLVVDDDAALRDVMQVVLTKAGYQVYMCADAAAALAQLTAHAAGFDLLISDVVMFGTGGPELARQARARVPDLPVLFVSGHAPELVDQRGAFDAGTEFLAKPFSAEELLNKVRETLAGAPRRSVSLRPGAMRAFGDPPV
jgi:CheY-like chemotaxis protein